MFSYKLAKYIIAFGLVFLLVVGYFVYQDYAEFTKFMDNHLPQAPDAHMKIATDQASTTKNNWSTFSEQDWQDYWSNQKPVKVRYSRSDGDTDVVAALPPGQEAIYQKDLVPQLVETPDGQVHKMYWYSKLWPGQAVPPREQWPGPRVFTGGAVYPVPPGETSDSFIEKIELSTMYDVPLHAVDSLIADGMLPNSLESANDDPIFDDPNFNTREDSRPLEASIPFNQKEWGLTDAQMKMMTEGIPAVTETRMINGKMMTVEVETGWVLGPSDEAAQAQDNPNQTGITDTDSTDTDLNFFNTVDIYADYLDPIEIPEERFPIEADMDIDGSIESSLPRDRLDQSMVDRVLEMYKLPKLKRERRGASSRDAPSGHTHPDGQSHDDSP